MKYRLEDLIDIGHFQDLQDRLNEIYSFPSSIIDNDGKILTATAWQDVCTKFHRQHKEAEKICIKSDQYIKDHIHEANPALTYRCPHGLVDNATPIVIDGVHYGNFFTGQFFLEEPDLEFFKAQAEKYGFDEEAYLAAVKKVPIWTQKQLDNYLFFIKGLIAVISESGLKRLKEIENRKQIEKSEKRYRSILKASLDGYWLTDQKGRLLDVNEAYCRMSGYSEDELLSMSIPDLEIIETPELVAEHMKKVVTEGTDIFETKHRRKDGTVFDVEVSVQFRADEGGQCVCFLRDVTEKKRADKSLRDSEAKYRLLVENQTDLIVKVAREGKLLFVSPSYCAKFGISESELLDKKFMPLVHEDDREKTTKAMEALYSPPHTAYVEQRAMTKDGWRWLAWSDTAVLDEDGAVAEIIGVGRDVTVRKKAEEALERLRWMLGKVKKPPVETKDSAPEYGDLTELNQAGLIKEAVGKEMLTHIVGDYLDLLDSSAAVYELNGDYALGIFSSGWCQFMDKASRDLCETDDNRKAMSCGHWLCHESCWTRASKVAIETGQPVDIQCDGGIKLYAVPIFAGKEVVGSINVGYGDPPSDLKEQRALAKKYGVSAEQLKVHAAAYESRPPFIVQLAKRRLLVSARLIGEIVERNLIEKELQESEEKYRSMMESMDESTYICSSDFHIEYMNPAMIERVGRDATGELCYEVLYGFEEKCPWCVKDRVINDGEVIKSELLQPSVDQTYLVSHSPVYHADGTVSKLSIYRDVTELKSVEARLQQAQKMESIGTLAGGIAHDFNNILFPIVALSEMLMEDLEPESVERENAKEIFSAAIRGSELVKQILAFSRQSETKMIPVAIQRIMREVLKLCRSTIPSSIEIIHDIQSECSLVRADPIQIHQIAMNLITNAYHAVQEKNGQISVVLKEIEFTKEDLKSDFLSPGRYAVISVSDNGHGINPDDMKQIFEPYFTTKEKGKGTGLGLAVVHGIVKEHQGDIQVTSELNKGTTFNVLIPIMKTKPIHRTIDEDVPAPRGDEHILLVDDEEAVVQMEQKLLDRLGYRVSSFGDSLEALEAFKANPKLYDLVLSDMTMPNMTGERLAKEILAIAPEKPIIICTGFSERLDQAKAMAMGIKGFLLKPVAKAKLAKLLRKVIDEAKG